MLCLYLTELYVPCGTMCSANDIRDLLRKKFDEGLNTVAKKREISALSEELNFSEQKIKNFIGNERQRRKRKKENLITPPQKLRSFNPYNYFLKDFIKQPESQGINNMADRNRAAGEAWRGLGDEEKQKYFDICETNADVSAHSPPADGIHNTRHELKRILQNLQQNCEWAQKMGIDLCFIVAQNGTDYCGGTEEGRNYLVKNPHLPKSFVASLNHSLDPCPKEPTTTSALKREVMQLLNNKYAISIALGISKPNARVPYKNTTTADWIGLPNEMTFRHPSAMIVQELKFIKANISSIFYIGKVNNKGTSSSSSLNVAVNVHDDHNYTQLNLPNIATDQIQLPSGHTMLSNSSPNDSVYLP